MDRALSQVCGSLFTGAVARVEHRGRVVFERAYGSTRDDQLTLPVYVDTRFDLASLTKLFIATLALSAVAAGTLTLDGSLVAWFPQWRDTERETISLRMLLAHTSGMHSGADYRELLGHDVATYAIERPLAVAPGAGVIYSDLGFIALGELLQRVGRASLAAQIPRPGYRPRARDRRTIPATENDGWRGRVQGVVHDEKAYLMDGVAGHAGLFGTAADVARLAQVFLAPLCRRTTSALPQHLIEAATSQQAFDPVLRRGLGWALKTTDNNSCGAKFSRESFGHTGFVGTCVWADPARDVLGVLLTNAVYFGRFDSRDLRVAFYDGIVTGLDVA